MLLYISSEFPARYYIPELKKLQYVSQDSVATHLATPYRFTAESDEDRNSRIGRHLAKLRPRK